MDTAHQCGGAIAAGAGSHGHTVSVSGDTSEAMPYFLLRIQSLDLQPWIGTTHI